jgi:O-antigen ligase
VAATGKIPVVHRAGDKLLILGYGSWLVSYPVLLFLLTNDALSAGLGLVCGLGIATFHLLVRPGDFRISEEGLLFIGAFGFLFLGSQLFGNFERVELSNFITCFAIIAIMFIAALIANSPFVRDVLAAFSVLGAAFLLIVYLDGDYVWGRLVGRGQPNYWGMLALSVACAALAIERRAAKAFVWGAVALILHETNARGSLLSAAFALGVAAWFAFRVGSWRIRYRLALLAAVLAGLAVWSEIESSFISGQLLRFDDPHRGLDRGGNRLEPWLYGLTLWLERPLLGHGYRESESLFEPFGLTAGGAHNGYITMLIDTGILGLLVYLTFLGRVMAAGLHVIRRPEGLAAFTIILGYATIGWFERYALNAGQATSILFLIAAFYVLSARSRLRAGAPLRARIGVVR